MLNGAPSVYASRPLSDGRRIWRACLISCCRFLSFTSLLLILSSVLLCQMVLLFLSKALVTFQTSIRFYCGRYNPGTRARAGITAAPAPLSPAFKQAIREFVLVLLLRAEGDTGLGCCLMAMVDETSGPGFPGVYTCFLFWTCSLNLCLLSSPRMGGFGSMLQI